MELKTKTILLLVGIFVAGVVSGGLSGGALAGKEYGWLVLQPKTPKPAPRDWVTRVVDSLHKELSLTPEQRASVDKIVRDSEEEFRAHRREYMAAVDVRMRSLHDRVSVVLNAEQKVALAAFQKREEEARIARFNPPSAPPASGRPSPEAGKPATP